MGKSAGIIAVFAKPPRAGEVKTRLAASIGATAAAELARAFVGDVWDALVRVDGARRVLASTETGLEAFGLADAELWLQGDGDLGERIERVARRALEEAPWFIAVGADSPGLPLGAVESARAALLHSDAALGPADDGGYYLLALRRLVPGLLSGLPWSAEETFAATRSRLVQRGLSVAELDAWFDVDDAKDLARLTRLLRRGAISAPRTAATLATLELG
jgi:uncharacterized protein